MASSSNSNSNSNGNRNVNVNEKEELCSLPEDIVFQILLWLPVVSLLRFKSVCKSWCSLIQSPRFIHQHKHKSTGDNLVVLLRQDVDQQGRFNFKVLSSSSSSSSASASPGGSGSGDNNNINKYQVYENLDLPECFEDNSYIKWSEMISCNGIICLNHKNWDVSLWNPATKQYRILPKSQIPLPPTYSVHFVYIGFGFDAETNDYKVIRFVCFINKPVNNYSQVEVYSLNDNFWKILDFVLPIDCVVSDPKTPYKNGEFYCWMGRNFDEGGIVQMISFDFTNEIFGTIPLPNDPTFQSCRIPQLAILRGKIASIYRVDFLLEIHAWYYQIWVMNEYGVKESWTKLYTVGPFSFSQPIGFPKNENLVLLVKDQQQLCLCDPVTQQIINLPAADNTSRMQVAVYKESLLPIK